MTFNPQHLTSYKKLWLSMSGIPPRFMGVDRERIIDDVGSYPQAMDDWAMLVNSGSVILKEGGLGTTGVGLLLDGEPGKGKTTHAVAALQQFLLDLPDDPADVANFLKYKRDGFSVSSRVIRYMTYPEFLTLKKSVMDLEGIEKANRVAEVEGLHGRSSDDGLNVRILVLDDLGKEYGTAYNGSSFDEILRSRYDKGLPTIVTTNVALENWDTAYSPAMQSFAHEAFSRVQLTGNDLRK